MAISLLRMLALSDPCLGLTGTLALCSASLVEPSLKFPSLHQGSEGREQGGSSLDSITEGRESRHLWLRM